MSRVVFLALDYMVGIGDQDYARDAVPRARAALEGARRAGHAVVFTKVGFRPGHPEVSPGNRVFGRLVGTDQFVGASSRLLDTIEPGPTEPVLDKKRFSAFAGSGLWTVLRAQSVTAAVLCGLSTSGVVLSTALDLIDADLDVTVLSDACADPDPRVHSCVLNDILSSRSQVRTVADWLSQGERAGLDSSKGT